MRITKFSVVLVPTALGQPGTQIYGLGDDSKMYYWDFRQAEFKLFQEKGGNNDTKQGDNLPIVRDK